MRHLSVLFVPAVFLCSACGTNDSGTASESMVSREALSACGGFTAQDAAAILGLPPSEVSDESNDQSETLRLCSFRHSESAAGVSFYLSIKDSVEEAMSDMEYGRSMAGLAQDSIDAVTGTETEEEPLGTLEGVGDEAYFMSVNGTLTIRVGNVQVQVLGSVDREKMAAIGRKVADGLRAM